MISVRLDREARKILDRLAREQKLSRSELVRRGIRLLAAAEKDEQAIPWDQIGRLVGRIRGGPPDLSEKTAQRFRSAPAARMRRRS